MERKDTAQRKNKKNVHIENENRNTEKANDVHLVQWNICKKQDGSMDPYSCVVDTGCPKTVAGKKWMDLYIESQGDTTEMETGREDEKFRFGPSKAYRSEIFYEIEISIMNLKKKIKISVVDADIPLSVGLDYH